MGEYLTTGQLAERLKISPSTARRRIEAGRYAGAVRLSGTTGPWRVPVDALALNDHTPPAPGVQRGGSAANRDRTRGDLMSRGAPSGATAVQIGQRAVDALHTVTTRPSRAAAVMAPALVAVVARHYANRDGWCAACSWQHPCTDYVTAAGALEHAAGIVLDGAA